jgi:hypothetical protein
MAEVEYNPEDYMREGAKMFVTPQNKATILVGLSQKYAPILKRTGNDKLLDTAMKYQLPLSEEQLFLVDEGDTFLPQYTKRILKPEEEDVLYAQGWNPLTSSNLKAVKIVNEDLHILFHNTSVYRYPGKAEMFYPFNEALSPGRLLWRTIRLMGGYECIQNCPAKWQRR